MKIKFMNLKILIECSYIKTSFFFITNEKKIFIFKTTDMESDELIKIIKTTGILFEKKKNHLIFISIVKKEKVFKNKQRMVDLSSF